MGTTAAFVVAKHQGIEITTNELKQFRTRFMERSRVHVDRLTYEPSGPKNSQQHTITVKFSGFVSTDDLSRLLSEVDHPYVIRYPHVSQPAPQGIHRY